MKREENMKYWKQKFFVSKLKKFKQHSINIKNYTAHPHDMVHVPAKFRENTSMRLWVTVRKLNVTDGRTDGRTDGGRCNISRPGLIWFDFIECFTTTFLRAHSWLNWVDEDDDEHDEVGLKEKPVDTRYIKKITSK